MFHRGGVPSDAGKGVGGVFEFLHPDPQVDQQFKPTRNLCGQILTIYISIYMHDLYTHKV